MSANTEHAAPVEATTSAAVVSNRAFIEGVFHRGEEGSRGWGTSFHGDPKSAPNAAWRGAPGPGLQLPPLDETANTFFNISSLKPYAGQLARKEENFAALHVVVLDDIGTKASLPTGFKPSYMLETSPGNFQCGLVLDVPCADLARAKAIFKALAAKNLTDAGAQGPQSRYVRLPVGVNHKAKCGPGGFPHRLTSWSPERRFSIAQIVSEFDLTLDLEAARATKRPATAARTDGERRADSIIIGKILRSTKVQQVWEGGSDGALGFSSGSDADQYLLTVIAFQTEDPEQLERIYSQAGRAGRASSDGSRKWQERADYRMRSIAAAFRFVEQHPHGDIEEARATVEAALILAKQTKDCRPIYAPDSIEALCVLQRGDAGSFDHCRQEAKKAGATLSTLDAEINRASDQQALNHDEAASIAIEKLGGVGSVLWNRGQFWCWQQHRGVWVRIESDEKIKQAIHAVLPRRQINAATVGSVLSVMRTKVARETPLRPTSEGTVVNCANGEMVLRDRGDDPLADFGDVWELRPHQREHNFTSVVPVAFDESASCPTFLRFLDDITEGDDDAEPKKLTIVEAIAYSLLTTAAEEKFFVLYGPGSNNGKSTTLALVEMLAGKENAAALSVHQLGERFALANLQSKLVNLCGEIPRGAALPDDAIKKLSSGDVITAERKGQDHFEFRPHATLWFATNSLPSLRDLSPATLEKRCIVLTMNRRFEGEYRDTNLRQRLAAELPGIFTYCMNWYGRMLSLRRKVLEWRWTSDGERRPIAYLDALFMEPRSSIAAKAEWRRDSDPVLLFAEERLAAAPEFFVSSAELFAEWQSWASANGIAAKLTARQLTGRLKAIFPQVKTGDGVRHNGKRGILGLGLADE